MGNQISLAGTLPADWVSMSNGGTAVLLSVLLLAGSDLASTPWERGCVRWLSEHDQDVFGLGVVGFDLSEICMTTADFEAEKTFLLRLVDTALARHRWEVLSYDPPFVSASLQRLRALVERLEPSHFVLDRVWKFALEGEVAGLCPLHRVFLHPAGCLLCNDVEEGPCRGTCAAAIEA